MKHFIYTGFGIGTDSAKRKEELIRQKNIEKRLQERLKKENNLSQINQSLIIVERTIGELNTVKENFNVNDSFNVDLTQLNQIKTTINKNSTEIGRLEIRKELILESKQDLENEVANIDTTQIKSLYEKAKSFIPSIQTSFEDTRTIS